MAKSPAFQWYARDFAIDTQAMTAEEVGIYVRLLNACWIGIEGAPQAHLVADEEKLRRIAGVSPARWRSCRDAVLSKFSKNGDGRLSSKRMLEELEKQQATSGKASASASKRWEEERRRKAEDECDRNATALPAHCETDANGMLCTLHSASATAKNSGLPDTSLDSKSSGPSSSPKEIGPGPLFGPTGPTTKPELVTVNGSLAPPKRKDLPKVKCWDKGDGVSVHEMTDLVQLAKGAVFSATGNKASLPQLRLEMVKRDLRSWNVPVPDDPMIAKWLSELGSYAELGGLLWELWDSGHLSKLDSKSLVPYVCKVVSSKIPGPDDPVNSDDGCEIAVDEVAELGVYCPAGFELVETGKRATA